MSENMAVIDNNLIGKIEWLLIKC